MSLSFFASAKGSGRIRGHQVAAFLGARLNPADGYWDDACIWVKMQPPEDLPPRSFLDIVDGKERIPWLREHPEVGVIACSLSSMRYLEKTLRGRTIGYIPQHHANFERRIVTTQFPPRLGVVGGTGCVPPFMADEVQHFNPKTREAVVAAYQAIDIQLVWRRNTHPIKNPLKILNAASFGIPTVAYPSDAYEEFNGCYWPARTEAEARRHIKDLTERGWDRARLLAKAERFHIERVARMYPQ